ncbi:unnamed protein product [Caretta caretta]
MTGRVEVCPRIAFMFDHGDCTRLKKNLCSLSLRVAPALTIGPDCPCLDPDIVPCYRDSLNLYLGQSFMISV